MLNRLEIFFKSRDQRTFQCNIEIKNQSEHYYFHVIKFIGNNFFCRKKQKNIIKKILFHANVVGIIFLKCVNYQNI